MELAAFVFFPFLFGPFFGFGFVIYFLPTIVALVRHKRNTLPVFLLNLFLGWTLIGWIIALVWASTVDVPAPVS
jgi:T4 superinfection immunity protein